MTRPRLRSRPRHLFVAGGIVVAIAGCTPPRTPTAPAVGAPASVKVKAGGRVSAVALEEYVLASALAEVSPVDQPDAAVERIFEVQAVIARTYAVSSIGRHHADGYDLCSTTHCQLYDPARVKSSRFATVARAAVRRTAGRLLTFGARPAEAVYHADCGGHTAGAETVWGGRAVPYLAAGPDRLPADPHRKWRVTASTEQLRAALNANTSSAVGRRLDNIRIADRDVSGRVTRVDLVGERPRTIRGEELRAILNARLGSRAILSTKLSITRPTTSQWVIEGTGFGHGVGLCQVGAAARARRGDSLTTILAHYFPGATLGSPRTRASIWP